MHAGLLPSFHTQRLRREPRVHGSWTQLHNTSRQCSGKAEGRRCFLMAPGKHSLAPTPVEVNGGVTGKLKEKQKQRILGKEHRILLLQKILSALKGSA